MNKKKVLVTGGSGFIGEHLVELLQKENYNVLSLDKKTPSLNNNNIKFIKYDLLDGSGLVNILKGVDSIIHLAAEVGGVAFANNYPAKILRNNSLIDSNIIEAAVRVKVNKFIYISSSLIYEKAKSFPLKEGDEKLLPPPSLSYGLEKLFGENLCFAYKQELGMNYAICRLFNVYGKNVAGNSDPNGHVIPDLIKKVRHSTGTVEIWGSKGISRNFTHVDDISHGILEVFRNEKSNNEIINIANSKEYTLEQVVEILWRLFEKKEKLKFSYTSLYKKDVNKNLAGVLKAKKLLGWSAQKSLEDGLREMI